MGRLGFYLLHGGCDGGVEWVCGDNDCCGVITIASCIIQGCLGFYLLHGGCSGGVEWVGGGNGCGNGTIAAHCII
ncbi:hypothetical protein VNO80_21616 [Phaseolus coccineus]|uniref:Uncharacterized protein n=1 Tax=Phaseolus coccineus TaxID=3886 RepID=A0AAN9QTH8_PHACN